LVISEVIQTVEKFTKCVNADNHGKHVENHLGCIDIPDVAVPDSSDRLHSPLKTDDELVKLVRLFIMYSIAFHVVVPPVVIVTPILVYGQVDLDANENVAAEKQHHYRRYKFR